MSRRATNAPVTVFLSAVSAEFQEPDPADPHAFLSYRDVLARSVRSLGRGFSVTVQEELAQGPADLLATLDAEVARSDIVVHLVGYLAGHGPRPAELRRLQARHPDLLRHEPELAAELGNLDGISYTQWEIYLAFEHRSHRLVYLAGPNTRRSPRCTAREMEASQVEHLDRLREVGEHRISFVDQNHLALQVVTAIVRFDLDPEAAGSAPADEAVEAARRDAAGLTRDIAEGVRKPDRGTSSALDPAGIEAFLRSVDTAALRRELDRRTALEVVAEHREELLEAAAAEPTAEGFRELALAELAIGNYPGAIAAARRCAELGEAAIAADPGHFEGHREATLNGYLLMHDGAKAAGQRDEAVAALERGGSLIDRAREPTFWADFHQPLAEFHLEHAHWDRAEELVDEIVDIREEHQPEQPALAESLLLWCRLLRAKANFSGMESVAARAERMVSDLIPPELPLVAQALNLRAIALRGLGRLAEAEPLFRRALAIDEASYGPDHPNVAADLNNLATLLRDTGRLAEAEPLFRRALAVAEASYGPDHHTVAIDLNNLATLLRETGRLA
jgi:tetratricopeptide (TPR) repeat protein